MDPTPDSLQTRPEFLPQQVQVLSQPRREITRLVRPPGGTPTYTPSNKAVLQRPLEPGQFTLRATAQLCRAYGIAQSVGRIGVCWDNAAAESFLGTLKKELVNRADYRSRRQARLSIRYWIEAWYNPRRLHSTIGQQPPNEWEDNYYHHTAA